MNYQLDRTLEADKTLQELEADKGKKVQLKAVKKALGLLQIDPKYPSLQSSPIKGESCPHNSTLWHSYAQNNTPGVYRIFWCYVPKPEPTPEIPNPVSRILIIRITPHD